MKQCFFLLPAILLLFACQAARAITINYTYDSSFDTQFGTNATAARAALTYAASQLSSRFTDNININVTVMGVAGTGTLASTLQTYNSYTYAQVLNGLTNTSLSADDSTAVASVPATNPTTGLFLLPRAHAKMLNLIANGSTDTGNDATVTFGAGQQYTFNSASRAQTGRIDFIGAAMHELTEVMGRVCFAGRTDLIAGTRLYTPYDLFRFRVNASSTIVRSLLPDDTNVYFSINSGTTNLNRFNYPTFGGVFDLANGGDLGDWATVVPAINDSFNAFSDAGVLNALTEVDIRAVDILGWRRAGMLQVQDASSVVMADNDTRAFGTVNTSSTRSLTFTIRNTGGDDLTLSGSPIVTISGTDAAQFTVTSQPTSPVSRATGSTTFTVRFAPTSAGAKSARLTFASSDPDRGTFRINVTGTGNAAPSLTLPSSPIVLEATSASGAVATFSVSASDPEDGALTATASPASGSTFALGNNTVTVSATDSNSYTTTGTFIVKVQDTTAPVLTQPADVTTTTTGPTAYVPHPTLTTTDAVNTAAQMTFNFTPSGTVFPIGTTSVSVTATDAAGNVSTAKTFNVIVTANTVSSATNNDLVAASTTTPWVTQISGTGLAAVSSASLMNAAGQVVQTLSINSTNHTSTLIEVSASSKPSIPGEYFIALDGNPTTISIFVRDKGPRLKVDYADKPSQLQVNDVGDVRINPQAFAFTSPTVTLPTEPASTTYVMTLTNTGEATNAAGTATPLKITGYTKTGTGSGDFTLSPNPTTSAPVSINAGETKTITVTFNAGGTAVNTNAADRGPRYANFSLTSNSTIYASGASAYVAQYQGNSVEPTMTVSPFGDSMPIIADGDTTPSTVEGTDYGAVAVGDTSANWGFFTIRNTGTSNLTIADIAVISPTSGTNLAEFPLTTFSTYPLDVAPGGEETFYVGFQPLALNPATVTDPYGKAATVRIRCNVNTPTAATGSVFNFKISGKALQPVLEMRGKGIVITSGAAASGNNGTALGSAVANSASVDRTFSMSNIVNMAGYNGNYGVPLNFDNVEILPSASGNTSYLDFSTSWPSGLNAGDVDYFVVSCAPSVVGTRTAKIKLTSNAAINSTARAPAPFYLNVSAKGTAAPVLGTGPDTTDFTAQATAPSGTTALVSAMATDGDGQTIVAGSFTAINGTTENRIARFTPDGVLDTTFAPNVDSTINAIVVLSDGSILIGGAFTKVNGVSRGRLARLLPTGDLDTSFCAGANNGAVNCISWVPALSKWLIGGTFTQMGQFPTSGISAATNLQSRFRLAVVDNSGVLDTDFKLGVNPGTTTVGTIGVHSILVDYANRLWVGGSFANLGLTSASVTSRANVAVINPTEGSNAGGVDATVATPNFTGAVNTLTQEPAGSIIVGGAFTGATSPTSSQDYLSRLLWTAGTTGPANVFVFDTGFTPALNGAVNHVACQAGGGLLVGGVFTQITARTTSVTNGLSATSVVSSRIRLARLVHDGYVDADFNPNYGLPATQTTNSVSVYGLTIDESGDIFVYGRFTHLGATLRTNSARLANTTATDSISHTTTAVQLTLSDTSPTLQGVNFESLNPDGVTWTLLSGTPTLSADGKQWTLALPSPVSGYIRATGYVPCGFGNNSVSLIRFY